MGCLLSPLNFSKLISHDCSSACWEYVATTLNKFQHYQANLLYEAESYLDNITTLLHRYKYSILVREVKHVLIIIEKSFSWV